MIVTELRLQLSTVTGIKPHLDACLYLGYVKLQDMVHTPTRTCPGMIAFSRQYGLWTKVDMSMYLMLLCIKLSLDMVHSNFDDRAGSMYLMFE